MHDVSSKLSNEHKHHATPIKRPVEHTVIVPSLSYHSLVLYLFCFVAVSPRQASHKVRHSNSSHTLWICITFAGTKSKSAAKRRFVKRTHFWIDVCACTCRYKIKVSSKQVISEQWLSGLMCMLVMFFANKQHALTPRMPSRLSMTVYHFLKASYSSCVCWGVACAIVLTA